MNQLTQSKKKVEKDFVVHFSFTLFMCTLLLQFSGYEKVSTLIFSVFGFVAIYQILKKQCLLCQLYKFLDARNIEIKSL